MTGTNGLVSSSFAAKFLGITRVYFHALVRRKHILTPVRLSKATIRWKENELKELKDNLIRMGVLPLRKDRKPIDISDKKVPNSAMATRSECAKYLGVTVATWHKLVKNGEAPKPWQYKGFTPKWNVGEVRKLAD